MYVCLPEVSRKKAYHAYVSKSKVCESLGSIIQENLRRKCFEKHHSRPIQYYIFSGLLLDCTAAVLRH